ncbi:MAG: hypothetical protein A3G76_00415 [Acidobacteria bacterium RIFCSPLOWO2_12_FULL_65_11]|nr:MAG: hypothetical protein A3H95_06490 [Acidobacteria bacterium RIFCSPLOWO2_02_FULL_64_15]OFW34114.1 MAG: hypothetical protein A3G76_00415 [Acidobacteria bacterium RIFCSPLOWO2_12_FULL_65_11]
MHIEARQRVARVAVILTCVILASRVWFIFFRYLDFDEFEHAHATWSVSRGLVPYVDFFEHHTPWLYLLFAPLFPHFATDTDPTAAAGLLVVLRLVMWAISIASVACVYELGRLWRDRFTGVLAAFLFASASQFQDVILEYRPDGPALLCVLLCLIAVMHGWRSNRTAGAAVLFTLGGLALGAAVLFTQKALFVLPGLAAALVAYVWEREPKSTGRWRRRAMLVALCAAGAIAPVAWTAYWFDAHQALDAFVHYNVDVNVAQNAARFSPLPKLLSHLVHSPALMVLGLGGFVVSAMSAWAGTAGCRLVLLGTAASLWVGVFVIPRVYDHYLVTYFPHLAVFTSSWAIELVSRIGPRLNGRAWFGPALVLAPAASLAALVVGVEHPTSVAGAAMIVSFTLAAMLAAAVVAVWQHARPETAACLALAALVALQAGNLARVFRPIAPQLADLAYVTTHTRPTDTVLGATSGPGVFRPHAWYYFFLSGPFATDREFAELIESLESERRRPQIVIFGENERRRLPLEVWTYVRQHYRNVRGDLYERLPQH